jgi:endonuclease YncB( thermonuclease family)
LSSQEFGREADIALQQLVDDPKKLRDCVGGEWNVTKRIAARWTIRRGELFLGKR